MTQISLQDLRRVVESLASLRERTVTSAVMRSDRRQLKIETRDGVLLVVSVELDESGVPRLEVDVVRQPAEVVRQLEVRFDSA